MFHLSCVPGLALGVANIFKTKKNYQYTIIVLVYIKKKKEINQDMVVCF